MAAVRGNELDTLLTVIAIIGFAAAVWCAFRGAVAAAFACAIVAVLILLFA